MRRAQGVSLTKGGLLKTGSAYTLPCASLPTMIRSRCSRRKNSRNGQITVCDNHIVLARVSACVGDYDIYFKRQVKKNEQKNMKRSRPGKA